VFQRGCCPQWTLKSGLHSAGMTTNPWLSGGDLPDWSALRPADLGPAIELLLAQAETVVRECEAGAGEDATLCARLSQGQEPLYAAWRAAGHLMSVDNTPELRTAHAAVQPQLVAHGLRVGQSKPLYTRLRRLRDGSAWSSLSPAQARAAEQALQDMELAGVGLEGPQRERFQTLSNELAELSTRFGNQLLDAAAANTVVVDDAAQLDGVPQRVRDAASGGQAAGPWRIAAEATLVMPILEHATDRSLREAVYRAWMSRAAGGANDNGPVLQRILALRHEQAQLLGFADYATLSLARKMAGQTARVHDLLDQLVTVARPKAVEELHKLTAFARQHSGDTALELRPWDIAFWAERLRRERHAVDDEALRPWLGLDRMLAALAEVCARLFGVHIEAAPGAVPVWHEDVQVLRVRDARDGRTLAHLCLDAIARPGRKRPGAWMSGAVARGQRADASARLPIAYLCCNFPTPAATGRPSLLSPREVETLYHEMGHALQHCLTIIDEPDVCGIHGVEWDAVELPSQMLEQFALEPQVLHAHARHADDGTPIAAQAVTALHAARHFRAGSALLRQLQFALVDLDIHGPVAGMPNAGDPETRWLEQLQRLAVVPPIPEDRMLCSFGHLFAGGYAAGYYSYLWAEVLSADAYEAISADATAGRRFRDTVLALGGSVPPAEVYRRFRGRDADPAALLRQRGLSA
jgi:oligopeptidase A